MRGQPFRAVLFSFQMTFYVIECKKTADILSGEVVIMNKKNSHYKKAVDLIKSNNVSEAINELKLCLKFNSKSISALNLLGLAYYLKCRFDKADKTWRKSLAIKRDNNKARDYLELITKKDFKIIREEYKKILFNDEVEKNKKIDFLKRLIEEYDELIEPYVVLGLLYKKEENYEEALKYFYQAYDLDSGNQNIKNYIMQCEEEDKNTALFNMKSKTNKKSALTAALITLTLFLIFLNQGGLSPLNWIGDNVNGIQFSEAQEQEEKIKDKSSQNSTADIDSSSNLKTGAAKNKEESSDNLAPQIANRGSSSSIPENMNLLEYKKQEEFLTFDTIRNLLKKEESKKNLTELNNFLEEGTEQQLFNLAVDYFSREDYQEAAKIFKSIYSLSEKDYLRRESLFLLARSQEKMDNFKSAEHFYRIYLNEYSDTNYYDEALYNLGLMLNRAGDHKKSREVLKRLRRENPYSEYNNSQVYEILN